MVPQLAFCAKARVEGPQSHPPGHCATPLRAGLQIALQRPHNFLFLDELFSQNQEICVIRNPSFIFLKYKILDERILLSEVPIAPGENVSRFHGFVCPAQQQPTANEAARSPPRTSKRAAPWGAIHSRLPSNSWRYVMLSIVVADICLELLLSAVLEYTSTAFRALCVMRPC